MSGVVTFDQMPSRIGTLRLAATQKGICKIALGNETASSFMAWIERHIQPETIVKEKSTTIGHATRQLAEYLEGQRHAFDVMLDIRGTDFQRAVWMAVAAIPYGQTRSYADIAATIGKPLAVRAVGTANGANPIPLVIPCHRVVGKNGALTGYGGGLEAKRLLLEMERDLA